MGMGGMGTGGASASGSGMPSPFSVSMSGSGPGGMTSGGGGKGAEGGMPFSPFSSAMSGAGSGKGIGGSTRAGMGGVGVMGSTMGTENAVSAAAYNKDCVGAECSAKNRIQHRECPDLVHCLITCDGSYMLGQLDDAGCQTCSCTT
ncbi:keratin, type II cytoskeletal 2 epidermal-like [Mercenaria mercenaria]|uniref:keratin, type II cytoskeletal 2 epidermal-like n=1 Tax=Mercenaria mercenaria TaxID=6596 RepID=UPI00234F511E|nr:keratin, type II cytoskeletal 2 epidermal-like [Mercenaria mercenaria]